MGISATADPTPGPARWWTSPLNISLVALAIFVAGFAAGTFLPRGDDPAVHGAVDTGFCQDMRIHHEQAVTMAVVYRSIASVDPSIDGVLATIALEIETSQGIEVGRMVQLLRIFGENETNETETAMAWMGHPVPLGEMPGLASDDQLTALRDARGPEADRMFATLMIAHHEGGIAMASHAAEHARNPEVRRMAAAMVTAQTGEINELRRLVPPG